LLGLLREEQGLGARVLEALGVTVEQVRAQVARIIGEGDEAVGGQVPFTPRAKKVLEHALREAIALGHDHIGTEHVLLALTVEEGVAAQILADREVRPEKVRDEVLRALGATGAPRARPRPVGRVAPWRGTAAKPTHGPAQRQLAGRATTYFVIGWCSFGASLGLGVLIGWLVWG
jgi:ATP-dependent Clp protease ATP-binding subunit ClpC